MVNGNSGVSQNSQVHNYSDLNSGGSSQGAQAGHLGGVTPLDNPGSSAKPNSFNLFKSLGSAVRNIINSFLSLINPSRSQPTEAKVPDSFSSLRTPAGGESQGSVASTGHNLSSPAHTAPGAGVEQTGQSGGNASSVDKFQRNANTVFNEVTSARFETGRLEQLAYSNPGQVDSGQVRDLESRLESLQGKVNDLHQELFRLDEAGEDIPNAEFLNGQLVGYFSELDSLLGRLESVPTSGFDGGIPDTIIPDDNSVLSEISFDGGGNESQLQELSNRSDKLINTLLSNPGSIDTYFEEAQSLIDVLDDSISQLSDDPLAEELSVKRDTLLDIFDGDRQIETGSLDSSTTDSSIPDATATTISSSSAGSSEIAQELEALADRTDFLLSSLLSAKDSDPTAVFDFQVDVNKTLQQINEGLKQIDGESALAQDLRNQEFQLVELWIGAAALDQVIQNPEEPKLYQVAKPVASNAEEVRGALTDADYVNQEICDDKYCGHRSAVTTALISLRVQVENNQEVTLPSLQNDSYSKDGVSVQDQLIQLIFGDGPLLDSEGRLPEPIDSFITSGHLAPYISNTTDGSHEAGQYLTTGDLESIFNAIANPNGGSGVIEPKLVCEHPGSGIHSGPLNLDSIVDFDAPLAEPVNDQSDFAFGISQLSGGRAARLTSSNGGHLGDHYEVSVHPKYAHLLGK